MILNEEQLRRKARELALTHTLSRGGLRASIALIRGFDRDAAELREYALRLRREGQEGTRPAEEWLLDHADFIAEQTLHIRKMIRMGETRRLPALAGGRELRMSVLCADYLEHADGLFDADLLAAYAEAYQEIAVLTIGEVAMMPLFVRIAVIRRLAGLCRTLKERREAGDRIDRILQPFTEADKAPSAAAIRDALDAAGETLPLSGPTIVHLVDRLGEMAEYAGDVREWLACRLDPQQESLEKIIAHEHGLQASYEVSASHAIQSLRRLDRLDWSGMFERLCHVDRVLRTEAAGTYPLLDASSRQVLLGRVQELAERMRLPETLVAKQAVELAARYGERTASAGREEHEQAGGQTVGVAHERFAQVDGQKTAGGAHERNGQAKPGSDRADRAGQAGSGSDRADRAEQAGSVADRADRAGQAGSVADRADRAGQAGSVADRADRAGQAGSVADRADRAGQAGSGSDRPASAVQSNQRPEGAGDAVHPRPAYTAYYLLDPRGVRALWRALRLCAKPRAMPRAAIKQMRQPVYFGALAGFFAVLWALAVRLAAPAFGAGGGQAWLAAAAALLLAFPASEWAVQIVHQSICAWCRSRPLLRYDFSSGIPDDAATMVVVPVIWTSPSQVRESAERLELHYLASRDPNLHFALLGDFADADEETKEEDRAIADEAVRAIEALNRAYGSEGGSTFHVYIRRRTWNEADKVWMGWERKRGKLVEFADLLRGEADTSYAIRVGDPSVLPRIRYLITLDADTQLPIGAAQRMIGTMHYPYNRPRLNEAGTRVTEGYGVLQPRIGVSHESAMRSRFARLWSGEPGIDPYAFAMSDPYQDGLDVGIFTGKGILDVDTFRAVLRERIPDNRVLSHDLLEGGFLRGGLLPDIELVDGHPATFSAYQHRQHRWIRGDWQLLGWLRRTAPDRGGRKRRVDLSPVTRWQIVDNLRRSLMPPALLALLALGMLLPAGAGAAVCAIALATLAMPVWRALAAPDRLIRRPGVLAVAAGQALSALATLPYQAVMTVDAIARALYRMAVSRRKLLEWISSAEVERLAPRRLMGLEWGLALAAAVGVLAVFAASPARMAVGLSLAAIWACAPIVIGWLDRAAPAGEDGLTAAEKDELRKLAADIWRFYEDYATERDNWLPPDNVQIDPPVGVARRTSPTNIGMLVACTVTARDFGFIDTPGMIERLERTIGTIERMEKWNGHLYNWYSTETLRPLPPQYVSTVDSGNLIGCLIAAKEGLAEWLRRDDPDGAAKTDARRDAAHGGGGPAGPGRPAAGGGAGGPGRLRPVTAELEASAEMGASAGIGASLKNGAPDRPEASIGHGASTEPGAPSDREAPAAPEAPAASDASVDLGASAEPGAPSDRETPAAPEAPAASDAPVDPGASTKPGVPSDRETPAAPEAPAASDASVDPGASAEPGAPSDRETPAAPEAPAASDASVDLGVSAEPGAPSDRETPAAPEAPAASGTPADLEASAEPLGAYKPAGRPSGAGDWAARGWKLVERIEALIAGTDFRPLFDPASKLFSLGFHTATGERETILYDLLASEARQASFIAIALGQVPVSHWFKLGRAMTRAGGGKALVSWSGTMFEYLMPPLLMRTYAGTVWDATYRAVIRKQAEYARLRGVPMGISESGYFAFDFQMNYQYRAFGVPGLGFKRGLETDLVVAPYATVMALLYEPRLAMDELRKMEALGARGEYGYYEAIDCTRERLPEGKTSVVIRSFMAHHQGMMLLTLGNLLLDRSMVDRFHADKRIRSAELLLQERVPERPALVLHAAAAPLRMQDPDQRLKAPQRTFRAPHPPLPEVCVLSNGSFTTVVTASGNGYLSSDGLAVTRWREDACDDAWGIGVYIRDVERETVWSAAWHPTGTAGDEYAAEFSLEQARFMRRDGDIRTAMDICAAAEGNAEIRRITITNRGGTARLLEATTFVELALAEPAADAAHPAFSKLFIETAFDGEREALLARRRPRSPGDRPVWAVHGLICGEAAGPVEYETDRARFIGRGGSMREPRAICERLTGTTGAVIDPIFAVRRRFTVPPGGQAKLIVVTGTAESREDALELYGRFSTAQQVERAFQLAWTRSRIELHHLHMQTAEATLCHVLAGRVLYAPPLRPERAEALDGGPYAQSGLWPLGISGDLPIVLVKAYDTAGAGTAAELVRCHEWLRRAGVLFDLVFLIETPGGYHQELRDRITRLIGQSVPRMYDHRPGRAYALSSDQLREEEIRQLVASARVVLRLDGSSLRAQLRVMSAVGKTPAPAFKPSAAAEEPGEADAGTAERAREGLAMWNGWGGFVPDGSEYRIVLPEGKHLPAPWSNVVANPDFGFLITERGTGCTWFRNSREFKLTPWSNDPVLDPAGEACYIRDEETGRFWSVAPAPAGGPGAVVVSHGRGYSRFERSCFGIRQTMTVFAARHDPVKITEIRLANTGSCKRRLTVTGYVSWVLGVSRENGASSVGTEWDGRALYARNAFQETFRDETAFLAIAADDGETGPAVCTADRREFVGRGGSLAEPAAMKRRSLSGAAGRFADGCGAVQLAIELEPGAERTVCILLGCGRNGEEARGLVSAYADVGRCAEAFAEAAGFWKETLGQLRVETPDPAMDMLLNGWLLYQTLSCRMWARSAFYQSGGAYGFRDQLQDSLALLHTRPDLTRRQILIHAAHQYREGDVQHWWHEETERGVRTRYSDDLLWLPYATARYVLHTGDMSVLDETRPFLVSKELGEGEHERYERTVESDEAGTVYEHCLRAINRALRFGGHGLPLMGIGDWNDGMNLVGSEGRGESVWLGWFLMTVLGLFAEVCERRGDGNRAAELRRARESLAEALNRHAWDGEWYRRAYTDGGEWLGTSGGRECRIDAIAQSWSVISGGAPADRALRAMRSFDRELVDRTMSVVRLLTPPFNTTEPSPGYIQGYPPGIRENGGQYTHGVIWSIVAWSILGDGDRAYELFDMLNPIRHTASPREIAVYLGEPYAMAADVYMSNPYRGRAGWTWYTGAAGWMYQAGIEWILGIRREGDRLRLEPRIPAGWPGFRAEYRYGGSVYAIEVRNRQAGGGSGPVLTIDGKPASPGGGTAFAGAAVSRTPDTAGAAVSRTPDTAGSEADRTPDSAETAAVRTDTAGSAADRTPDTAGAAVSRTPDTAGSEADRTPDTAGAAVSRTPDTAGSEADRTPDSAETAAVRTDTAGSAADRTPDTSAPHDSRTPMTAPGGWYVELVDDGARHEVVLQL